MPVYVNTFFERRVEQLFNLAELLEKTFSAVGLEERLTKDIDIAVRSWRRSPKRSSRSVCDCVRCAVHVVLTEELGSYRTLQGIRVIASPTWSK